MKMQRQSRITRKSSTFLILLALFLSVGINLAQAAFLPPVSFSEKILFLNYGNRNDDTRVYYLGNKLDKKEGGGRPGYELPPVLFLDERRCMTLEIHDGGSNEQLQVPYSGKGAAVISLPSKGIKKGTAYPVFIESPRGEFSVQVNGKPVQIYHTLHGRTFFYIVCSGLDPAETVQLTVSPDGENYFTSPLYKLYGDYPRERIDLPVKGDTRLEFRQLKRELLTYENRKVSMLIHEMKAGVPVLQWAGEIVLPLEGRITSRFGRIRSYNGSGYRNYHKGTDIGGNPRGTPVRTCAPGTVLCAEEMYSRGGTVIIDHGKGIKSIYYHLEDIHVEAGEIVAGDDVIGTVGTKGFSTGPHLHWELRVDGIPVSPDMALDGAFTTLFQ